MVNPGPSLIRFLSQLKSQWAKYRPPALPTQGGPSGPYANNPPPPQGYYGQQSSFNGPNPYGNNPPPPPQTYQPSMAGMYGNNTGNTGNVGRNDTGTTVDISGKNGNGYNAYPGGGGEDHEHGYEWAQAREQERLERERMGAEAPPPGYDVSASECNRQSIITTISFTFTISFTVHRAPSLFHRPTTSTSPALLQGCLASSPRPR